MGCAIDIEETPTQVVITARHTAAKKAYLLEQHAEQEKAKKNAEQEKANENIEQKK